jgi:hypothetical protein
LEKEGIISFGSRYPVTVDQAELAFKPLFE